MSPASDQPQTKTPPSGANLLPVAVLLWLAGVYLRIPILVAPPLAPFISDDLGLSQALTGALTTLPILMLAVGSMPGSLAISRLGPRNTLALAMVIMVIGSAGRGVSPDALTLMLASAIMGLGISMMQPSLPALLPRWLEPKHLALGTAIYMNGMLIGEFIGGGITLPVLMPLMGNSWQATLLAWSLPGLLVAAALYLPKRDLGRPTKKPEWLPDWKNPNTLRIGVLLGLSGSLFFGFNAYMGSLLEQQGHFDLLADALFWFNFAQLVASTVMLKMAKYWVGRKLPLICVASCSLVGAIGTVLLTGWWSIASATFMSMAAGIMLILLVALPPVLVDSAETGRLSAGNFLVGYTLAFSVPMLGGLLADWGNDARYAVAFIIAYCALAYPLTFTINLNRKKETPPPA
ncbi:MFS transporter [Marinobacter sp. CHS3-4]|uniref:MFS transporter n=1 Tax=Marinobacter sp. CHS3-4 TaxID=3045174 RepID=UPI0024B4B29C|nr:MFS transporter [Marinobacter sp. CHS3-4]MDI9243728.1 MFS transporter [Marinobacter sp. CHS3-4]